MPAFPGGGNLAKLLYQGLGQQVSPAARMGV